mmetsp:Transcript_118432/g.334842  ORF Transcript_118432/g.334842 Transcript_118432/m.334842 type:complete len:386 (+) Transcript_118432:640-1797(+)
MGSKASASARSAALSLRSLVTFRGEEVNMSEKFLSVRRRGSSSARPDRVLLPACRGLVGESAPKVTANVLSAETYNCEAFCSFALCTPALGLPRMPGSRRVSVAWMSSMPSGRKSLFRRSLYSCVLEPRRTLDPNSRPFKVAGSSCALGVVGPCDCGRWSKKCSSEDVPQKSRGMAPSFSLARTTSRGSSAAPIFHVSTLQLLRPLERKPVPFALPSPASPSLLSSRGDDGSTASWPAKMVAFMSLGLGSTSVDAQFLTTPALSGMARGWSSDPRLCCDWMSRQVPGLTSLDKDATDFTDLTGLPLASHRLLCFLGVCSSADWLPVRQTPFGTGPIPVVSRRRRLVSEADIALRARRGRCLPGTGPAAAHLSDGKEVAVPHGSVS